MVLSKPQKATWLGDFFLIMMKKSLQDFIK